MRIVKNTSLQGFYISFTTPEGNKDIFLAPKSSIETPDSWSSPIAENLVRRRMVKVRYVEDKAPSTFYEPAPLVRNKKRSK